MCLTGAKYLLSSYGMVMSSQALPLAGRAHLRKISGGSVVLTNGDTNVMMFQWYNVMEPIVRYRIGYDNRTILYQLLL